MYILYKDDYDVNYERLVIERALIGDAGEVLALQKLAYRSEAETVNDFAIQPLTQTEEETVKELQEQMVIKVSAVNDKGENSSKATKRIIASVRGFKEKDSCHIGKLTVHPQYQNMGIGTELLGIIESHFNSAARYELFTGEKSARNIRLYEKSGYKPFKTRKVNDRLSLVFMEKQAGG